MRSEAVASERQHGQGDHAVGEFPFDQNANRIRGEDGGEEKTNRDERPLAKPPPDREAGLVGIEIGPRGGQEHDDGERCDEESADDNDILADA